MYSLTKIVAISILMSGTAYAGQPGAMNALLEISGPQAEPVAFPAPLPSPVLPEELDRAFASDLMDLDPSRTDLLVASAREAGYAVMQLDGSKMTNKRALFSHTAKGLNLHGTPQNWDSMIDLLRDMHMIHSNERLLIVVRNSSKIFYSDARLYADFRETAALSCADSREWSRGLVTMKFVFVP